jgi:hypothetical protein
MRSATRTRHHDDPTGPHGEQRTNTAQPARSTALQSLVSLRDRLADKYFEGEAHGQPDVLDTVRLLGATEDAIRNLSPTTYRTFVTRWAEQDAQRETADHQRADACLSCAYHGTTGAQLGRA